MDIAYHLHLSYEDQLNLPVKRWKQAVAAIKDIRSEIAKQ